MSKIFFNIYFLKFAARYQSNENLYKYQYVKRTYINNTKTLLSLGSIT